MKTLNQYRKAMLKAGRSLRATIQKEDAKSAAAWREYLKTKANDAFERSIVAQNENNRRFQTAAGRRDKTLTAYWEARRRFKARGATVTQTEKMVAKAKDARAKYKAFVDAHKGDYNYDERMKLSKELERLSSKAIKAKNVAETAMLSHPKLMRRKHPLHWPSQ